MRNNWAQRPRGDRGQALVETAIVMPLYVFLILGILQLGLMHQARLITKYAAYKAVRAGALANADKGAMETAALAALLPLLSQSQNSAEQILPVDSGMKMATKWPRFMLNIYPDLPFGKIATVHVCGPTSGEAGGSGGETNFDDPAQAGTGNRTKLRVEVEFLYRMPIPFANAVIYALAAGQEVSSVMRMGDGGSQVPTIQSLKSLASSGVYAIPIRASYAMRMHSNPFGKNLPGSNECRQ